MADLTLSPLTPYQAAAVSTVQGLLETLRPMATDPAICPGAIGPGGDTATINTLGDLADAVASLDDFLETMARH